MKCSGCPVSGTACPGETYHPGLCKLAANPLPGTLDLIRHRATLPAATAAPKSESAKPAPGRPRVTVLRFPPCPFRERCGCQRPICHDPDMGPAFGNREVRSYMGGRPDETVYRVDAAACGRCRDTPMLILEKP